MTDRRTQTVLSGVCLTAALGFLTYLAVAGLTTTGRHLLVLSVARAGFLAGLLAVVGAVDGRSRLGRAGLVLAAVAAALNVLGAVGHVVTDGWAFDPFAEVGSAPPWYSYVIGASAMLFALGTLMVGISVVRLGGPRLPAVALLLAGTVYVLAIPLGAWGHALWTLPWLVVAAWTLAALRRRTDALVGGSGVVPVA